VKSRSRDSSVGIAAGYGLDDRGVGVPEFSSPRRPDRLWGSTQPPIQWAPDFKCFKFSPKKFGVFRKFRKILKMFVFFVIFRNIIKMNYRIFQNFGPCLVYLWTDDGLRNIVMKSTENLITSNGAIRTPLWGESSSGVKLTTHLQLVARSRKCGSINSLLHTSSWLSV
jgi:hypothetical protein